jgi:hypothetical protein
MTRHSQLVYSLALVLALAVVGCAGSDAVSVPGDAGPRSDAGRDTGPATDGPLAQEDATTPQDDAAPADAAPQQDAALHQDAPLQQDAALQQDTAAQQDATQQDAAQQDATQQDATQQDATQQDATVTTRTITGTSIAHRQWDTGSADEPDDLSAASVMALVANGASYTTYAGTGDATGHFTIPNVPVGPYLLFAGDGYYYRMATDTPNLDYYVRGRPAIATTSSATNLVFNVTNLSAYHQNGDDVLYYSSNTDAYDTIAYTGAQPTEGATTLSKTYDLNGASASNVLATTADHPILIDYVGTGTATTYVATAARSFSPAPYAQANGASQNVSGAFATIASTTTTGVSWFRSEFHGGTVIADIGPSAAFDLEFSIITAQPGGLTHGVFASGVDLAQLYGDSTTSNLDFGNVTYGNPFDGSWEQYLFTLVRAKFPVTAPGATAPATVYGWVRTMETRASSMSVHMLVSPPRALQINGQAASANLTGVTTSPTLSWTAPATGTATTYQVYVYRVSNSAGSTARAAVAAFYTDQTSVKVPAGLLSAGTSYQFRVMAISDPNANYAVAPWLTGLPHGDATAFTALATP